MMKAAENNGAKSVQQNSLNLPSMNSGQSSEKSERNSFDLTNPTIPDEYRNVIGGKVVLKKHAFGINNLRDGVNTVNYWFIKAFIVNNNFDSFPNIVH